MAEFTVTESIPQPRAAVWSALVDFERAHRWMSGIDRMRLDGELIQGSTVLFRARGSEHHSVISRLEPPGCLALTSQQGSVTAVYTYTLEDQGAGTLARLHALCRATGPMRLAMPLLGWLIRRTDGGQLADLKRHLETLAPSV